MLLNRRFIQYLSCLYFLTLCFPAFSQPPIQQQIPTEILPNQIDPKNLSQTQLSALLSDKNKENAGKDKNAEFMKNNKLDKDSLIKDNIRTNSYSPDKTYGANIFQSSASMDLSELSTPPL